MTAGCSFANSQSILDEKIAKMLIIGFDGTVFSQNNQIVKDIVDTKIGGVIVFERNITPATTGIDSKSILSSLCGQLQALRDEKLIISIDQEGGRVTRLKEKYGFPKFVSAKYLGNKDDLDTTKHYADLTSKWLNELNINTNFTPCVDLIANINCPVIAKLDRAYSSDANKVASHASAVVSSSRDAGIYTSLKHFPGHGSSVVDSHKGFTDISNSWTDNELIPFKKLIKQGDISMIMVGHLFNNKFDDKYPATLSEKTVTHLLRKDMGWNGVIVTDDMLMGAIINNYSFEESVMLSINAGCDMFIYSGNLPKSIISISKQFIDTVNKLIKEGKISEKRIDESYDRIVNMLK